MGFQIVNEIENKVRELHNLNEVGFVLIFYKKELNVIGYRVIDENKKHVNTDDDIFAIVDSNGEVNSIYSDRLELLAIIYCELGEKIFGDFAADKKTEIILSALKEEYFKTVHIPLKLSGLN